MRTVGKTNRTVNVLICGVGGQGVLLASEILAGAAGLEGYDIKKSEVHGMAQRGGSVVSHVRYGAEIHSPLIPKGEADYLVSFEKMEAMRYLDYLHADSWALVNSQEILPLPVGTGKAGYPARIRDTIREAGIKVRMVDGPGLALKAGNRRAVNSVLLGTLSKFLDFGRGIWKEAIGGHVPERHLEANIKAFELGRRIRITKG